MGKLQLADLVDDIVGLRFSGPSDTVAAVVA